MVRGRSSWCSCGVECSCIRSSLHSFRFGQLLCCAHERILNIMKVYIAMKNIYLQIELIRFGKNSDFVDVKNFKVGI